LTKKKYGGILITEADKEAGEKFDIIAAVNKSGNCPFIDEFFLPLRERYEESLNRKISINKKDKSNYTILNTYFERFTKNGPWSNKKQLKLIESGFFEFKNNKTNLRVIFYYDEKNRSVIVITHYFDKGGKDKTPQKEKKRMYKIKESFEKMREQSGEKNA
jgi:hypothetical protein